MDSLFGVFYNNGLRIRVASLAAVSFSVFSCSPLQGISDEINHQYDANLQMTNILSLENINNPQ